MLTSLSSLWLSPSHDWPHSDPEMLAYAVKPPGKEVENSPEDETAPIGLYRSWPSHMLQGYVAVCFFLRLGQAPNCVSDTAL